MLDFQKEMQDGTKWRLTLAPQRGAGATMDGWSVIHEASVSVPITDLQTRFIAGQIPDQLGRLLCQHARRRAGTGRPRPATRGLDCDTV